MYIKFDDAINYKNLLKAYKHCRKGKKFRSVTVTYHMNYQFNLLKLLERLRNGTYEIDKLYTFTIFEPKKREITANRFEDKIVQRLICKYVLEPIIQPKLIYDNYASQPGKGTHKALKRLVKRMRAFSKSMNYTTDGYVLTCDIHKYFYTINREICYKMVEGLPIDPRIMKLIKDQIYATEKFDNSTRGLCIGFQSSQWLAIYYLNGLDHFIKENLGMKYYGRYMDDFNMFHESKEYLEYCYKEIEKYVIEKLDLTMNPKSHIHEYSQGVCFLGYHCYYNPKTNDVDIEIRSGSINRMLKRTRRHSKLISQDRLTKDSARMSINSWHAYAEHGETEKAKNAYREAISILGTYEYDLMDMHEYGNPYDFDNDGFIKLKYKPEFRDKDGFIKLQPKQPVTKKPIDTKKNKIGKAKESLRSTLNMSFLP